jgi:hypothetical protein
MRTGAAIVLIAALTCLAACGGGGLFQQYEYEEDIYLELSGAATVYANGSSAAFNALRGASFDTAPSAEIDREAVRAFFTTPVTRVARTTFSRRSGRRFLHVRLETDDIARLSEAAPFAWSSYSFKKDGDLFIYRQAVGPSAARDVGDVGWTGQELVAFRLHLPSAVVYHNAGADNLRRGNILVWEQALADRLRGEPLALDARIEAQSILSRTLLLFAAAIVAVAVMFGLVIWLVVRRGARPT